MSYLVRRCEEGDMEAVLTLARKMHEESPLHRPYPFSIGKVYSLIENARASAEWLTVVVHKGEQLVGFALVTVQPMYFSYSFELNDLAIYIRPEDRGTRAAILLTKYIEHWADSMHVDKIALGLNTGINHDQALSFYSKLGYVPTGIQITKSVH